METTEKIVESCCRYVKQWFTIPNIKCKGLCNLSKSRSNNLPVSHGITDHAQSSLL